jgi:nucleotide-binding universal stress UspA family protein
MLRDAVVGSMYDDVLLATDGSDGAAAALAHAVTVASADDATLHAVSVVETRTAYDNAIVDPEEVRANLRADARAALSTATDRAEAAGLEHTSTLEEGPPPEVLLSAIDRTGADLVVCGATGRSGFKRLVVGSTAERLLEAAPVPVAVVSGG